MTEAEEIDSWIHWASARIDNDREKLAHRNATIARLSGVIEKDWLDEWIDAEWPVTATSHQTRTRRAGARLLRDAILAKAKTEGA